MESTGSQSDGLVFEGVFRPPQATKSDAVPGSRGKTRMNTNFLERGVPKHRVFKW